MKYLTFFAILLLTGCLPGKRPDSNIKTATDPSESAVIDSLIYNGEMSEFACYFQKGKYNKELLANTSTIFIYDGLLSDSRSYWNLVFSLDESVSIDKMTAYYNHLIDSATRVEILDFEPWITFKRQIIDWNRSQFDKNITIAKGIKDPETFYEYDGIKDDSVMKKCVEILCEGGDGLVSKTRNYMTCLIENPKALENDSRTQEQKDHAIKYALSLMHERLSREDSIHNARSQLIVTISNRINSQIHEENNIHSNSDLISYQYKFHELFDSVREFNIEEP